MFKELFIKTLNKTNSIENMDKLIYECENEINKPDTLNEFIQEAEHSIACDSAKSSLKNQKNILSDIWQTIKELKNKIHKAFDDTRKQSILKQISDVETMIPKPVKA